MNLKAHSQIFNAEFMVIECGNKTQKHCTAM